ncbi:MAG: HIT family protein [Candidatus Micrarchaeia archaeon]
MACEAKPITGKKKEVDCISCAIMRGELNCLGGTVYETNNFNVSQDLETPIPGFMIISSKRHVKGIEDFTPEERSEFIETAYKVRKALTTELGVEFVYFIIKEDSSHFHAWLFPRFDWMKRFGGKIASVTEINEYARENMCDEENLMKVREAAEKLRKKLNE